MFSAFRLSERTNKVSKSSKKSSSSFQKKSKVHQSRDHSSVRRKDLISPIATLLVGREGRIFAAHEHVLSRSPFLRDALQAQIGAGQARRVLQLVDETPEILSAILEYLYTRDYKPRLVRNHHGGCELEAEDSHNPGGCGSVESTLHHPGVGGDLLKDTAVYCAAEKYDLEELKEIALRKQGLRSGIPVDVIIRSARFAYDNTPDTDSRLRAHYLALIIRSRDVFKRSGTMQMEMEIGGSKLFFDLFVAMSNHVDDVEDVAQRAQTGTPRRTPRKSPRGSPWTL